MNGNAIGSKLWVSLPFLVAAAIVLPASALGAGPAPPPPTAGPATACPEIIGVATMHDDGTLVLRLRTLSEEAGTMGGRRLEYPPSHPLYKSILDHIGPLRPGLAVGVEPWPKADGCMIEG